MERFYFVAKAGVEGGGDRGDVAPAVDEVPNGGADFVQGQFDCGTCADESAEPAAGYTAEVKVAQGRVSGTESGGVVSFKGLPYVAAVDGANRWRAPQPAGSWQGVRDASVFAGLSTTWP